MENILSFLGTILTIMTALISLLVAWRTIANWPKWQSIPVAIAVSTMSILCVMTFIAVVFDGRGNDSLSSDDGPVISLVPESTGQERDPEPEMRMEVRDRTFNFGRRNAHCESSRDVRWPVNADAGWEIDVTTIKPRVSERSSQSDFTGVVDATREGFVLQGRVTNNGDCIKVLGKVVAKDGRGSLRVVGSYQETRLVPAASVE